MTGFLKRMPQNSTERSGRFVGELLGVASAAIRFSVLGTSHYPLATCNLDGYARPRILTCQPAAGGTEAARPRHGPGRGPASVFRVRPRAPCCPYGHRK